MAVGTSTMANAPSVSFPETLTVTLPLERLAPAATAKNTCWAESRACCAGLGEEGVWAAIASGAPIQRDHRAVILVLQKERVLKFMGSSTCRGGPPNGSRFSCGAEREYHKQKTTSENVAPSASGAC